MGELIYIEGVPLTPIMYRGELMVTFQQIDECHQRPKGTAKRNFTKNRRHLIAGEDYWEVSGDEIRTRNLIPGFSSKARRAILLNESGYLMVTKSFTDDRAWAVHRGMVRYFRSSQAAAQHPSLSGRDAVIHMADALQNPAFMTEALHQMIIKAQVLQEQLAAVAPDVAFARKVQGSKGSMTISEAAKACGMKPLKFFAWLRDHHFLMKSNMPYQRHIDRGLFEARISVSNGDGTPFVYTQPLITGKGLARVQQVMGCGQSLALELDANPSIPALPGGVL